MRTRKTHLAQWVALGLALACWLPSQAGEYPALEQLYRAGDPASVEGSLPVPSGLPVRSQDEVVYFCALGEQGSRVNGFLAGFSLARIAPLDQGRRTPGAPVPIIDDGSVTEPARRRAQDLLREMLSLSLPELRSRLGHNKVFLVIIPQDKRLTDLPQFKSLKGVALPDGRTWDDVRGVGFVSQPDSTVAVGVGEENLLLDGKRDYYPKGYLLAHEFSHAVHAYGLEEAVLAGVERMYQERIRKGLDFPSRYAATNQYEYFAVSSNVFFQLRLDDGHEVEKDAGWVRLEDPAMYGTLEVGFGRSRPLWPSLTGAILADGPF